MSFIIIQKNDAASISLNTLSQVSRVQLDPANDWPVNSGNPRSCQKMALITVSTGKSGRNESGGMDHLPAVSICKLVSHLKRIHRTANKRTSSFQSPTDSDVLFRPTLRSFWFFSFERLIYFWTHFIGCSRPTRSGPRG